MADTVGEHGELGFVREGPARGETLISEHREILGHPVARFIYDFELITRCEFIFYYYQIQIVVNPFTKNK